MGKKPHSEHPKFNFRPEREQKLPMEYKDLGDILNEFEEELDNEDEEL